uniref:Uncharacterized protein n=1 Tax=Cyanidium sp. THAL103 TaxID=3027999 RepID=A0A9Y1MYH8_9RHOD|nr:hypothetical protein CspTHAL103_120 [Cyanidium sp. THAL103]
MNIKISYPYNTIDIDKIIILSSGKILSKINSYSLINNTDYLLFIDLYKNELKLKLIYTTLQVMTEILIKLIKNQNDYINLNQNNIKKIITQKIIIRSVIKIIVQQYKLTYYKVKQIIKNQNNNDSLALNKLIYLKIYSSVNLLAHLLSKENKVSITKISILVENLIINLVNYIAYSLIEYELCNVSYKNIKNKFNKKWIQSEQDLNKIKNYIFLNMSKSYLLKKLHIYKPGKEYIWIIKKHGLDQINITLTRYEKKGNMKCINYLEFINLLVPVIKQNIIFVNEYLNLYVIKNLKKLNIKTLQRIIKLDKLKSLT